MAVKYGFFDSVDHDRVYNAADMSKYYQGLIGDGVVDGVYLNLTPATSNDRIRIKPGRAIIDCRWYEQDEEIEVLTGTGKTVKGFIVLKLDYNNREISVTYIDGSASSFPTVVNTADIKYLKLAKYEITSGSVKVENLIGTETALLKPIQSEIDGIKDKTGYATTDKAGIVKIGSGVNVDSNGTISVTGGGTVTTDATVSTTSTNPVQNQAITKYVDSRTVYASGIKAGIVRIGSGIDVNGEGVISVSGGGGGEITVDSSFSTTSTNPVQNKVITSKINGIDASIDYINQYKASTVQLSALQGEVNNKLDIDGEAAGAAKSEQVYFTKILDPQSATSVFYPLAMLPLDKNSITNDNFYFRAGYNLYACYDAKNNKILSANTNHPLTFTGALDGAATSAETAVQVTQKHSQANIEYPVLMASSAPSQYEDLTGSPQRTASVTLNPQKGTLTANKFIGDLNGTASSASSASYAANANYANEAGKISSASQEQIFTTNLSSGSNDYTIYLYNLFNDYSVVIFRYLKPSGAVYKNAVLPLQFIKNNASSTPFRIYVNDVPMGFQYVSNHEMRVTVHTSSTETFKLLSLIKLF